MGTSATVGSLNLMTLGIGLLVLIVIAVMFFRKKSNRHPMHPDEAFTATSTRQRGVMWIRRAPKTLRDKMPHSAVTIRVVGYRRSTFVRCSAGIAEARSSAGEIV